MKSLRSGGSSGGSALVALAMICGAAVTCGLAATPTAFGKPHPPYYGGVPPVDLSAPSNRQGNNNRQGNKQAGTGQQASGTQPQQGQPNAARPFYRPYLRYKPTPPWLSKRLASIRPFRPRTSASRARTEPHTTSRFQFLHGLHLPHEFRLHT